MLRAAIAGIMARGGASLGEKTLLDALAPATDSLEASFRDPATLEDHGVAAIQRAADVAVQAAQDTKGMLAMRGRAAYTGERSIGLGGRRRHRDRRDPPGHRGGLARQVRQQ